MPDTRSWPKDFDFWLILGLMVFSDDKSTRMVCARDAEYKTWIVAEYRNASDDLIIR